MSHPHDRQPARPGVPPRMPRWVKVLIGIAGVVVVVVVVMLLIGGEHGPQRHFGGGSNVALHTALRR
jgi:hypothetical protein